MNTSLKRVFTCVLLLGGTFAGCVNGEELSLDAGARTGLGLTVYSDGLALVRDARRAVLTRGTQHLAFREVAATIRPETASLKSLSGGGIALVEQNFDFDLLTPDALLAKYTGQDVTVIRTNPATGAETSEKARVLATNGGVVLRYADRIETGVSGRLSFPNVPGNLRDRPTLSMIVEAPEGGQQQLELTYLANQIGWKADYVANMDLAGKEMTLNGWVTLTNQPGAEYKDAKLQLVAGTLNRVTEAVRTVPMAMAAAKVARVQEATEEKIADYHLYTMPRPTTIAENQTKQIALLSASKVPVRKEYVLQSGSYDGWYINRRPDIQKGLKPSVYLRFENRGGDLGIPLPGGTVRVYAPDSTGSAQFIGEDAIAHTAKGEKIGLRLGEAFDLTADRTQTDYRSLGDRARQSSYRIEIRNGGAVPATVVVRENLHGDWRITSETQDHERESAATISWPILVPAEGRSALEYTAVVTW